jgi:hypothetical protein
VETQSCSNTEKISCSFLDVVGSSKYIHWLNWLFHQNTSVLESKCPHAANVYSPKHWSCRCFLPQLVTVGLPINTHTIFYAWWCDTKRTLSRTSSTTPLVHVWLPVSILSATQGLKPYSTNIHPCDSFPWWFVNEKLLSKKPVSLMEHRTMAMRLCWEITCGMMLRDHEHTCSSFRSC